MANPAAEARAKVKENHPEALVVERRRNSIKHRLADAPNGRKRYALDVAIGPFHYGPDNDQEIDTALVPSTAPWDWEMTKAGFEVRALSNLSAGQVIEYRSGSEWVRFQPMALQYSNDLNQIQQISMPQAVDATVDDDTLTWTDGYGPGRSLSWQAQTARLAKLLTINALSDLPAVDQFILDGGNPVLELNLIFAFSSGIEPYVNGQPWGKGGQAQDRDTQGLVEFRDSEGNVLWWFNLPRSWDAEGNEQLGTFRFKKQGNSLFVTHRVPLGFVQGAVYPLMVDVTVDEQVGASTDDLTRVGLQADAVSSSTPYWCHTSLDSIRFGCRWASVAVPNAATIDVSYMTWNPVNTKADPSFTDSIFCEDADDALTFVDDDAADFDNRTRTTASASYAIPAVTVDVAENTSSLNGPIQEVVDRGGWSSGNALNVLTNDLSTTGGQFVRGDSYDSSTTLAAKLHIEYTAAGGARRIFITHG